MRVRYDQNWPAGGAATRGPAQAYQTNPSTKYLHGHLRRSTTTAPSSTFCASTYVTHTRGPHQMLLGRVTPGEKNSSLACPTYSRTQAPPNFPLRRLSSELSLGESQFQIFRTTRDGEPISWRVLLEIKLYARGGARGGGAGLLVISSTYINNIQHHGILKDVVKCLSFG